MERKQAPWERASQQGAWYDDQPFDVGQRIVITDPAEQAVAGASAGRVVGYDASGPRRGEDFIRVLVTPDLPDMTIVALPPAALAPEEIPNERSGLALTMLLGLEQSLAPERYLKLLQWFIGDTCARLLADPHLPTQRIRLGGLVIPGLVLPELVTLARQKLAELPPG
jgi:hypothetical protein